MLIPGLSNADAEYVFVGTTQAAAVYLGTTQVWPTVTSTPGVMGEQLIINTTNNTAGEYHGVSIPAAATKFDVVLIGGGGGGGDGGSLGEGEGGTCGTWATKTFTVGTEYPAGHVLLLFIGYGGEGGQELINTGGLKGRATVLLDKTGYSQAILSAGGNPNAAPDRTGATPPDITFNGRTYKGGAGGTGTLQMGQGGNAPGGGGQGGAYELTGTYGGKGGSGGCYLYFY